MTQLQRAKTAPAATQGSPTFGQDSATSAAPIHEDPNRVVIGLPTRDPHHMSGIWWQNSLLKLMSQAPPGTQYIMSSRYGVAESREEIVNQALVMPPVQGMGNKVTHIFFLDTDVIPLQDNIINKMLSHKLPIVSGTYWNSLHTGINAWVDHQPVPLPQPQPLVEVDDIGFGCALIRRDVFETLRDHNEPLPWFHYAASMNKQQSEDFYFLEKCAKYGIKPVLDTDITCGHIRTMMMNVNGTATTI
jgi:hypothetical protein